MTDQSTIPEKQARITAPTPSRTKKGQFQKGVSGNPAGRPKGVSPVVLLAREHSPAAIQTLAEIACKGKNENARITAAVALLDRAYGRPAQSVEMDLKLTKNLEQMTLQELQEFRERYAALALASPALVIDHDNAEQPDDVPIEADNEQGDA